MFVIFCLLELFVELGQFGVEFADDLLHFVKFDGGYFELFLGFLELLSEGSYFLDDIPEFNNIDDPRAEASCCLGFVLDDVGVELRVGKIVFLDHGHVGGRKFVLVDNVLEAKQGGHEGLGIFHQLLGGLPVVGLGLFRLVGFNLFVET